MLPVIVSLLMMLMAGSLMVAFGLLAVFAVVRFRNVLRDTRDTVFVLWSIVEGMAVGTQRYSTAVIGAIAIAVVLAYLRISNFGSRRPPDGLLSVEIAGDPAAGRAALDRLFYRHASRWELTKEQTMPGQGQVLTYHASPARPRPLGRSARGARRVRQSARSVVRAAARRRRRRTPASTLAS